MDPIKAIKRKIKYYRSDERKYRDLWYSCEIDEKSILIEPGRGETVSGNMFALLKEIETGAEWAEYRPYFVVTEKTRKEAALKFDYYGFKRVCTVDRMSSDYLKLLASCKYFFTDNTYPVLFCKKPGQILCNTWHGTPLKHMGKANLEGARGIGNVQRNFFMSDFALFPNDFTRDVFMDDYLLRDQFSGSTVMLDYPRNDAFHDDEMRARVRSEQGLEGMRVYAYMPTWRGGDSKSVDMEAQVAEIASYLEQFDSAFDDDEVLYVNLHPFVGRRLSFDGYKHIRQFPAEYETYDFLNASDALITDYSSVFFDYAQTGRRIILFTYDLEDYIQSRGMYMDVRDLPFDKCRTVDEAVSALRRGKDIEDGKDVSGGNGTGTVTDNDTESFIEEYCGYRERGGRSCSNRLLRIVTGEEPADALSTEKKADTLAAKTDDGSACEGEGEGSGTKAHHIIAATGLENGIPEILRRAIIKHTDDGEQVSVVFDGGVKPENIESLRELDSYENVSWYSVPGGIRDEDMPRELSRMFPGWRIDSYQSIGELRRTYFRLANHLIPVKIYSIKNAGGSVVITFRQDRLTGLCGVRVGDYECVLEKSGDKYRIEIPKSVMPGFLFRNRIALYDESGNEFKIIAGRRLPKIWNIAHTKVIKLKFSSSSEDSEDTLQSGSGESVCYLQEYKTRTDLLVRPENYTDSAGERIKIAFAYIAARLCRGRKTPIILYEKNSERYEESASVLYEKLLDMGYNNVYYVIKKDCPAWDAVTEAYRSNLLAKYSFRHYLMFFRCKTFIATERITHNIDLRPLSPFLRYWLAHAGYNFVFLQHGVMYMVSLDSERRAFFRLRDKPGYLNRIVVSSELEADHFVERGGFDRNDLYVCGLLKFDRAERKAVHDRIVIMPTWRPGEANLAAEDFRETTYYKFISRIYNAVPDELKEKVIVLPHPLIKKSAVEASRMAGGAPDDDVIKLMLPDLTHEEVLEMTDTLITDYSSISYDAFYRGANVIFDWEEKDQTIAYYGKSSRLMLTEELAFGEVVYDSESLNAAIKKVYEKPHDGIYEERFRRLVTYHDGRNTKRFIEMAKKDGLI